MLPLSKSVALLSTSVALPSESVVWLSKPEPVALVRASTLSEVLSAVGSLFATAVGSMTVELRLGKAEGGEETGGMDAGAERGIRGEVWRSSSTSWGLVGSSGGEECNSLRVMAWGRASSGVVLYGSLSIRSEDAYEEENKEN